MITLVWESSTLIVPLTDVQHVDKSNELGLVVITSKTRWDPETSFWANNIWIDIAQSESFLNAWKTFLEAREQERHRV